MFSPAEFKTYVHNISPFFIKIHNDFGIRWYGLAYLAGLFLGGLVIYHLVKNKRTPLQKKQIGDFINYVAIGMMAGGRLGYVFFYSPDLLVKVSSSFPYWGVLEVNKGGMASHGGIMGIMVACYLFSRKYKLSFRHLIDLTVFGGSLGIFFGRIANFINGELYGRVIHGPVDWAVKFPQELHRWSSYVAEYKDQLLSLAPFVGKHSDTMLNLSSEQWKQMVISSLQTGNTYAQDRVGLVVNKIFNLSQSADPETMEFLSKTLLARHPSQLYQALMEGLFVFFILVVVWMKPRKAGIVSGFFGISYAIARIIGEQFRMPDAHIGYQLFHLTRGQWLSVGMLIAGIAYIYYSYRDKSNKTYGGWYK